MGPVLLVFKQASLWLWLARAEKPPQGDGAIPCCSPMGMHVQKESPGQIAGAVGQIPGFCQTCAW